MFFSLPCLSKSNSLAVCRCTCLSSSFCPPIYLSIYVPINLSTSLPLYLTAVTDLTIYLSTPLPLHRHLSTYLPCCPSTYLPTYLPPMYLSPPVRLPVCLLYLSIYLPTYLSIYLSTICLLTVCLFIHGTSVCRPSICLCVCLSFYLLSGYRSACRSIERSTYPLSSCLHTQNPHGCRTQGRIITYAYFGGSLLFLFLRPQ